MFNQAEWPGAWPGFCETRNLMEAAEILGRHGRGTAGNGDHRVQCLSGSLLRPALPQSVGKSGGSGIAPGTGTGDG